MGWLAMVAIAVGLGMDAFAVSIMSGLGLRCFTIKEAGRTAAFFGGFQAMMPVIGWAAGIGVRDYITAFDHWIAFGLLAFVGIKMGCEGIRAEGETSCVDCGHMPTLLMLSVATSIDALAVGLSLSLLNVSIITPVLVIGLITFAMSITGVYLGVKFGALFRGKVEIVGGLILLGVGFKILYEHLVVG